VREGEQEQRTEEEEEHRVRGVGMRVRGYASEYGKAEKGGAAQPLVLERGLAVGGPPHVGEGRRGEDDERGGAARGALGGCTHHHADLRCVR
jgi:hypothetical protein